ncbi:MAG: MFS transporter [Anaerolineae bacterium]|nr:MFS transporter [Anaerolineae bacterium]
MAEALPAEQIEPQSTALPPVKIDIAYSLISLGSTTIWGILSSWLLYFYLPPEGEGQVLVPAALYGGVIFVTRILNALLAPPVGYISDRTRTRWGRRLPYMFISALPMLVFFVLLWMPPVAEMSNWNLAYLALIYILYNIAYGFNQITYMALLPDIATTDDHRVRISAWSSSFFLLGMVVSALSGMLIDRFGYAIMALIYALVVLPLFYLPFLVLRERPVSADDAPAERQNILSELAIVFRNPAFVIMSFTGLFYWSTTTFMQGVLPYIVTEVCLLSKTDVFYFYIPGLIGSLICYPLITWLAKRFGKWRVFAGSLLLSALVLPGLMLIGEWMPVSLRTQGIIWVTLQAIAMSGVSMLPPAFGAEIADYGTELTGQRREGTYYAIWGLVDQVVNGGAAAILPLVLMLGRSHTEPQGPLGVRLIGIIGGVMMIVAFLIFLRYPLRRRSVISE